MKKHILNYRKTEDTYVSYRKAGESKRFFEEHRQEITPHKAAKAAYADYRKKKRDAGVFESEEEYKCVLMERLRKRRLEIRPTCLAIRLLTEGCIY